MIPSVEECFRLMQEYEMLDNIKAHSLVVERVAGIVARGLQETGEDISLEKVTAGALMHDIGKTLCLKSRGDHAAKGSEICLQNNLNEIADIVAEHVRLKSYHPDRSIHEKEIVYYADKRVNHDKVVSLEERLQYILMRYGRNRDNLQKLMRENFDLCKKIEKRLFAKLHFGPDELASIIE